MQYFGGKSKVCKEIKDIINYEILMNDMEFLSAFVGAGWVEQYVTGTKILNDKHMYLMDMYKELQSGWVPPTKLSKEEYENIKNNKNDKSYLTGFVGFGCSFAGKWWRGYAKNKRGDNYCKNSCNSILKKIKNGLLRNTQLTNMDYKEINPSNKIIYCDPPYKGTEKYGLVGEFNSKEFWDIMRRWSKNNIVFISEYEAPQDFKPIWECNTKTRLNNRDRVEKLFVNINQINNEGEIIYEKQ